MSYFPCFAGQQEFTTEHSYDKDYYQTSSSQGLKEPEPTFTISYRQLRSINRPTDEIFTQSKMSTSKYSSITDSVRYSDVEYQLNERKRGISLTVLELLDVSLRAVCAVSSFQKLLEERLWTVSSHEKLLLEKASLKEFTELILLNKIREGSFYWEYLDPMKFLVKVFSTLDSLEGAKHEARTTFSVCVNDFTNCTHCNSWIRSSLNLGALHLLNSSYYETDIHRDEKSFFNPEPLQKVRIQNEEGEKKCLITFGTANPESNLQQLLINSSCRLSPKYTQCENCKCSDQIKISKLHSLSAGLIITLPENSTITNVTEKLDMRECSAANAVYQFRAAVLRNSDKDGRQGEYMCIENLSQLPEHFSGSRLLFYERTSQLQVSKETQNSVKDILEFIKTPAQVTQPYDTPKFSPTLQYSMESDTPRECLEHTAGLEAALKGLFAIRGFSELFKSDYLIPGLLSHLNEIYNLHKQQQSFASRLGSLIGSLQVSDSSPHCWIDLLLSECDKSLLNERGSEVLRSMFPILKEKQTPEERRSHSYDTKSTNSCILDIPLKLQDIASHRSPQKPSVRTNPTSLEYCLREFLRPKSTGPNQQQFTLRYLGSALVILLSGEIFTRPHVRVPKTLDMKNFDRQMDKKYRLRAIIQSPESQGSESFTVLEIDNSEETSQLLNKGVNAYMLFFEQMVSDEDHANTKSYYEEVQRNAGKRESNVKSENCLEKRMKTCFGYGLSNLGNTCFMNAALNGLYSLSSFRLFFTTRKSQDSLFCTLKEFCEQYMQKQVQFDLLYVFKEAIPEFNNWRQHCANSYIFKLLMLLDTLLPTPSTTTFPQDIFGNKLRQYRKGKCEPLHDVFGTLAENLFICSKCSHTRRNFSYFRTVDVPIPYYAKTFGEVTMFSPNNFYPGPFAKEYDGTEDSESKYRQEFHWRSKELPASTSLPMLSRINLSQCFMYMLRASLMSPESLMQCDDCGFETQHYKQTFFRRLSTTFVIHFQRFNEQTGRKLNTIIDFPIILDMSNYYLNDQRQYTLRAVVYHFGSLNSGHYTAWINVDGRWCEVDDIYAREMKCEPPLENAYMLFYE